MQLAVSNIHKRFGDNEVLKGVNFTAKSGLALGLLGRNGAGKTTSIRIIMNVFPADEGLVRLDGERMRDQQRRIGYLPEEKGLYPKINIGPQLIYIGELRGLSKADAKVAADYWLDRLELASYRNKKLETLSKGNQQKIQLAVALLTDPEVVILDEPFSGLDPVNAQLLKEIVREQVASGKIVLFSSHQMGYVESFCDEVAILHQGVIALEGNITEIKRSHPRNRLDICLNQAGDLLPPAETAQTVEQLAKSGHFGPIAPLTSEPGAPLGARVTLTRPHDRDAVLAGLLQAGLSVERFAIVEPTLEDIFVRVTTADPVHAQTEDVAI